MHTIPRASGIYVIRSLVDNRVLVGQTARLFSQRFRVHKYKLRKNKHDNPYLQNCFNKHGEANLQFEVLETLETTEDLNNREIYWIAFYNAMDRNCGFNLREGGAFGLYSPELKLRVKNGIKNSQKAQLVKQKQAAQQAKLWHFCAPDGKHVIIHNLRKMCRELNLPLASMQKVAYDKCKGYKGWTSVAQKFDTCPICTGTKHHSNTACSYECRRALAHRVRKCNLDQR